MPIKILNESDTNDISIDEETTNRVDGIIRVQGKNNVVSIGKAARTHFIDIDLKGDRNFFRVEDGLIVNRLFLHGSGQSRLYAGANLRIIGDCRIRLPEPSSVTIGASCMFADQVEMLTSDFHPIFDEVTEERINPAKDIVLGEHVWLGLRVLLLKGANIRDNCVIGANSVISKEVPRGCIAAGNPARVVKTGVNWRIPF